MVAAGDTLLILSAMKMESVITAPCAGIVAAAQALSVGDNVATGQVVMVLTPTDGADTRHATAAGRRADLGSDSGPGHGPATAGPEAAGAGLRRPRRRPSARPRQADLPGAYRTAAGRRQLPRGGQRGRICLLRRRRRHSGFYARQPCRRLGQDRRPFRSRVRRRLYLAGRPRRRSGQRQEHVSGPPVPGAAPALGTAAGRLVGRRQRSGHGPGPEKRGREQRQRERRRDQGRPAAGCRWRRLLPARGAGQAACTPSSCAACRWSTCCSAA